MRYLSLLLALQLISSAHAEVNCSQLQSIAQNLESDVSKINLQDCEKLTNESLQLPAEATGLKDYRCQDYAAIDLQLQSVENEIAMLKGIASLKSEIDQGIETIKKTKDKSVALTASQDFYTNLRIAVSLEDFLRTTNQDGNILQKIANDKDGWTDQKSFTALIAKYCADGYLKEATVCSGQWALSAEVYQELDSFLKMGQKTKRKFDKDQIKDLQEALSIKKSDGTEYSYGALLSEIGDPKQGVLSKESIALIKSLPALESYRGPLNFRKVIEKSATTLRKNENLVSAVGVPDRFRNLIDDLKRREEWQVKSKLSFILNEHSKHVQGDIQTKCDAGLSLATKDSAGECLDALAKAEGLSNTEKSRIKDLAKQMRYGQRHIANLDEIMSKCVPDAEFKMPTNCHELIPEKLDDLLKRAKTLNALKQKQIEASKELVTMRNFVMEKLMSGQCMTAGNSDIHCDQEPEYMSKESLVLTEDTGKIIYLLENPKQDNKIDGFCENDDDAVSHKKEICKLLTEDDKKDKKSLTVSKDGYSPPVEPDTINRNGEAYLAAGKTILQGIAGFFAPKPQPMVNPYANNMNPYPLMAQPQDISQKIMTPYMAHGYGNYYPTPGLRPYSSVNSNVGTFSAYSFSGGKHFNSPVGW